MRRSLLSKFIAFLGLLTPLILYAIPHMTRPPRTHVTRSLFPGAIYQRRALNEPRPLMVHTVMIDLKTPGLSVFVTPGSPLSTGAISVDDVPTETIARTTSEFLQEHGLQLGVNANFFYPFHEKTLWDFYPHSGDRTNAVGQAISNGVSYSPPEKDWGVICFLPDNRAQILPQGECPDGTQQAVAGSDVIVQAGQPVELPDISVNNDGLYSRTVVALNQAGDRLWLVAIDDKQPFYSEGVTLTELAQILAQMGVDRALNLDGGGSTTLVMAPDTEKIQILNAPIHTKIPMRQRPVANHLGFAWTK